MTARLIDGKAFAEALRGRVAGRAAAVTARAGRPPGLAVVLAGDDPASHVYVRNKGKAAEAAGIRSTEVRLPADVAQDRVLDEVCRLNADPAVDAILVQLPLPPQVDALTVLAAIHPDKDADGFHVVNAGRLSVGLPGTVPCTPLGCRMLLEDTLGDLAGARAVVIGRSNIVGKPMAQLLLAADCTVTVAHSKTRDLPAVAREADILVVAAGRRELVRGDWIRPGAAVVDVGMHRLEGPDGRTRLTGDVLFAEAREVAGWITPVPGGVGPMTVACLLSNTVDLAERAAGG